MYVQNTYDHYCLAKLMPTVHIAQWAVLNQRLELVHNWKISIATKNMLDEKA